MYNFSVASFSPLRYWNVFGPGPMAETPSDFKDYRAFGPWKTPSSKQFGQQESVCGQTLNRCSNCS
ncbi:hypothetical protein ANCCAN_20520, partial [Ancylostoma caninum]